MMKEAEESRKFTCVKRFLQKHVKSFVLWRAVALKSRTSNGCGLVFDVVLLRIVCTLFDFLHAALLLYPDEE